MDSGLFYSDKPSNLHQKKNVGQAPNMRPRLSAASISLVHNRRSLVAGNGTWWCSMENNVLIWLVVDLPLWKIIEWKSVGMMTFPTEWKNKTCSKPPTRKQCSVSFYILLHRKHEHETSAKIDVETLWVPQHTLTHTIFQELWYFMIFRYAGFPATVFHHIMKSGHMVRNLSNPNHTRLKITWLVVDLPLWKIIEWKSVGMMTFPTEWKNKTCSKPPTRKQCSVSFYILLHRKHEHETSAKIDVWNTMSTTTYSHPYHIPRTMIFHDISVCWISRHRFSPYHEIRTYG